MSGLRPSQLLLKVFIQFTWRAVGFIFGGEGVSREVVGFFVWVYFAQVVFCIGVRLLFCDDVVGSGDCRLS